MNQFPEVGKEGHDFDGSAGFAGEDEQASSRVDRLRDLSNPAWNGGIEDPQAREPCYATLQPTYQVSILSLTPQGRELDGELVWRGPLWNGAAMLSLFYRVDPGHYANLPNDKGVAASWSKSF